MKVKITCTDGAYEAGLIYDIPEPKARALIDADKAFELFDLSDNIPAFSETVKEKSKGKVKHDNGQN